MHRRLKTPALSSWKITVLVLCAGLAWNYAPVITGRIPFPTALVFQFAAFAPLAPPDVNNRVANIGDVATAFYPYRTLASRAWSDGFPLWDPYVQSGVPFLANPQSALFYPPNFLYYVLPVPVAWCIGFLLRTFLSALFTALLLRRLGATTAGSLVAAFLFAFSGFMTVWQGQAMSDAAIWLPLICYAVLRLHEERSAGSVAIAALAFAMPVLAGHPETAAHLTAVAIVFALFLAFLRPRSDLTWRPVRHLALFTAGGVLAVGIAGVQILPTLEWLPLINRELDVLWPPAPLWTALGYVSRDVLRSTNGFGLEIPEQAAYIGMFAFLLVPIAWMSPHRRHVVFFSFLAVVAFCVVYGIGPVSALSQQIPLFNSFKNHRFILVVTFGLSVLAGLGSSVVEDMGSREHSRRIRAAAYSAIGFVLAGMMIYAVRVNTSLVAETWRVPRASFLFLAVGACTLALRLAGGLSGPWFARAALVVVGVDVCSFAYGFIPFDKPRNVFPENEVFNRLTPESAEPARVMQIGQPYITNAELVYRIPSSGGYELPLARLKKFVAGVTRDEMDSVMMDAVHVLKTEDRRMDMLNTKYYVVAMSDPLYRQFRERSDQFKLLFEYGDTGTFENLRVLPPAFLVPFGGIVVAGDEARQLELIRKPGFDPERTVVLGQSMFETSAQGSPGRVSWLARNNTRLHLKVESPQDSVLVLSQTFYPGWKAHIDGVETAVFPANYALTGIAVGAGPHDVVFSFDPLSAKLGGLLSILALVITGICLRYGLGRTA
jgi:hypothetical protein